MGDLREELIRLADDWEVESDRRTRAGDYGDEAMAMCAARIRSLLASRPAPSPSVSRDAALKARGFEDVRPVGGCADALGLAPSPRSEAEGTRAPACHCGDALRERPCPFCSPEAYYGAGRAPVPAESATTRTENCGHVDDGWEQFPCTLPTGHGGDHAWTGSVSLRSAATKGEEDGR